MQTRVIFTRVSDNSDRIGIRRFHALHVPATEKCVHNEHRLHTVLATHVSKSNITAVHMKWWWCVCIHVYVCAERGQRMVGGAQFTRTSRLCSSVILRGTVLELRSTPRSRRV